MKLYYKGAVVIRDKTNCNALHCTMPIATMRIAVNQALKATKINLIAIIFKNIKRTIPQAFPSIFQAFAMKIHVY